MIRKLLVWILLICPVAASAVQDSRMFVTAGRETFFNFPSEELGNKYTLTVFLPTEIAPIHSHYPVVYFVGLDRSDLDAFHAFAKKNQVFLVGLFIEPQELEMLANKIPAFLIRELVPYIDTNYATQADPAGRILAARGEEASSIVLSVFEKEIFGALSLQNPGDALKKMVVRPHARVFIQGTQEELAVASHVFAAAGLQYGPQYALEYAAFDAGWLDGVNTAYLTAPAEQVLVKKVNLVLGGKTLPLEKGKSVSLQVYTTLKNGLKTVFIPQKLRVSPPYLDWQENMGMLRVRSGAQAGPVKVTVGVDKVENSAQIYLKKRL